MSKPKPNAAKPAQTGPVLSSTHHNIKNSNKMVLIKLKMLKTHNHNNISLQWENN